MSTEFDKALDHALRAYAFANGIDEPYPRIHKGAIEIIKNAIKSEASQFQTYKFSTDSEDKMVMFSDVESLWGNK